MATLSRDDVVRVAQLSRLKLTEAEIVQFSASLGNVLDYFKVLDELSLEDCEPMVHAIEMSNVLRGDVVRESLDRAAALRNAPKSDGQFFLVPQVLD